MSNIYYFCSKNNDRDFKHYFNISQQTTNLQVVLKLLVDVLDDGLVGVLLVHLVAEPHAVHDGQLQPHLALVQLVRVGLQLHPRHVVVLRLVLEVGVEQRVHQRGLADARLADAQDVEAETLVMVVEFEKNVCLNILGLFLNQLSLVEKLFEFRNNKTLYHGCH